MGKFNRPKFTPKKFLLVIIILLSFISVPALLFIFFSHIFDKILIATNIFLLLSIAYIFFPSAKKRIENSQNNLKKLPLFPWLLKIFLLQAVCYLVFVSLTHLAYLPTYKITTTISSSFCLWCCAALISVALARLYYQENKLPLLSMLLPKFANPLHQLIWQRSVMILMSSTAMLSLLVVPTCLSIVYFSQLFLARIGKAFSFAQFPWPAVFLLLITQAKPIQTLLKFLCAKKLGMGVLLGLFIVVAAILLAVLQIFTGFVSHPHGPGFIIPYAEEIFCWSWWVGIIPLVSTYLVRISYGYSGRAIVIATILIAGLNKLIWKNILIFLMSPIWLPALILITPITLMILFLKSQDTQLLVLGFMPKDIKNPISAPRSLGKFFPVLLQTIMALMIFYLWFGTTPVSFFMYLAALPGIILFLVILFMR